MTGQLKAFPVLRNNLQMCTGAWKLIAQHEKKRFLENVCKKTNK